MLLAPMVPHQPFVRCVLVFDVAWAGVGAEMVYPKDLDDWQAQPDHRYRHRRRQR